LNRANKALYWGFKVRLKRLYISIIGFIFLLCTFACSRPSPYTLYSVGLLIQFDSSSEERLLRSESVPISKSDEIDIAFLSYTTSDSKKPIEDKHFESTSLIRRESDGLSLRFAASDECRHLVVDSANLSVCSEEIYTLLWKGINASEQMNSKSL